MYFLFFSRSTFCTAVSTRMWWRTKRNLYVNVKRWHWLDRPLSPITEMKTSSTTEIFEYCPFSIRFYKLQFLFTLLRCRRCRHLLLIFIFRCSSSLRVLAPLSGCLIISHTLTKRKYFTPRFSLVARKLIRCKSVMLPAHEIPSNHTANE